MHCCEKPGFISQITSWEALGSCYQPVPSFHQGVGTAQLSPCWMSPSRDESVPNAELCICHCWIPRGSHISPGQPWSAYMAALPSSKPPLCAQTQLLKGCAQWFSQRQADKGSFWDHPWFLEMCWRGSCTLEEGGMSSYLIFVTQMLRLRKVSCKHSAFFLIDQRARMVFGSTNCIHKHMAVLSPIPPQNNK